MSEIFRKLNLKKLSFSTGIITFLVISILALAGYIFVPQLNTFLGNNQGKVTPDFNKYELDSISVITELNKEEAESVVDFMTQSLEGELLPDEMNITLAVEAKNDNPAEYRGNWNKDGNFITILYVPGPNENEPQYMRIWTLRAYEPISTSKSMPLFSEIFNQEFLASSGQISCQQSNLPSGETITECGSLKTQEDGNLQGVTIRGPVLTEDDPESEFTVISSCFIPKEGTQFYSSDLCI